MNAGNSNASVRRRQNERRYSRFSFIINTGYNKNLTWYKIRLMMTDFGQDIKSTESTINKQF